MGYKAVVSWLDFSEETAKESNRLQAAGTRAYRDFIRQTIQYIEVCNISGGDNAKKQEILHQLQIP